jgi:hypothetical protein
MLHGQFADTHLAELTISQSTRTTLGSLRLNSVILPFGDWNKKLGPVKLRRKLPTSAHMSLPWLIPE